MNHEVLHYSMKSGVVVVTLAAKTHELPTRFGRMLPVKFNREIALKITFMFTNANDCLVKSSNEEKLF